MKGDTRGQRVTLSNIPRGPWKRCKSEAIRAGLTLNDWIIEPLTENLETTDDIREGLEASAKPGESVSWKDVKAELGTPTHSSA